jgi:serine phosphatase RsbU (regulator of sigma subunit)
VASIELAPADLLAIFSDGVSEAERGEEEFGEARLLQTLQELRGSPASAVVAAVFARVQDFSAGLQSDDLTLLVAQGRLIS